MVFLMNKLDVSYVLIRSTLDYLVFVLIFDQEVNFNKNRFYFTSNFIVLITNMLEDESLMDFSAQTINPLNQFDVCY
jgi:hypothetical protein